VSDPAEALPLIVETLDAEPDEARRKLIVADAVRRLVETLEPDEAKHVLIGRLEALGAVDDGACRAALTAFVQFDDGKPITKRLRELLRKSGNHVLVPRGIVDGLAELLDPTNARNLYRFLDPPPALSNENIIEALSREREQWFGSKEAQEVRRAHEAAENERARLREEMEKTFSGAKEETAESLADFAKESGDKEALAAFHHEAQALAKWTGKKQRSYAAVRLTTKRLSDKQCKLLDRNLNIMLDMREAILKGLRFSEAAISVAAPYGLTAETVGDICKEGPPIGAKLNI
jgi:hypothetical protein